ncbi:cache domain-containing protein [Sulfurovum sp.]|uniref:cache domain-containing protein n=1 Tax=Sulfurovum sp. TaxID=1969726 RepID=UPI002867C151|nr:cache domain-containing protein [Sulfurovum sp.]
MVKLKIKEGILWKDNVIFLKNKTIAGIHVVGMLMMLMVIIIFSIIVAYSEYQNFDAEVKSIQAEFIQKQKDTIAFDVTRVLKFISNAYEYRNTVIDENVLKKQILHAIEELYGRPDGTGYIFVYDFNGIVLSDPIQTQNIGKNLYTIADMNGVMVIKDLIDISRKKEGGFVEYEWLKPTTGSLSPKISYAKSFEPWGWMVGTGVYLDEVEILIQTQKEILKNRLNKYSLEMVFLLAILFIAGIIGIVITNRILQREISSFSDYFKEASSTYAMIDEDNIRLSEFKKMVHYINAMISVIHLRKEKLKKLNLTLESKVAQKTKDLSEQNILLEKEKDFNASLVKAQDSFIKHSIHEINTPLAVIMTHIDLFKMKEGENRYLRKIEAASKIISNIYDDLSYVVKKNRFVYVKKHLNISQFLEERIDFFSEIALGNQHNIIAEIQNDLWLYFSLEELQRIIDNNLSNAIKYANKDTDVRVILKEEKEEIMLKFLTISPKIGDTERIFKAYERENNVRGGFGLGLEIVYTICQKENVKIEVQSDDDMTVFSYRFNKEGLDESIIA